MPDYREKLDLWIDRVEDAALAAELRSMRDAGDYAAIADAFFKDLEFGTAGLRGVIGAGTNRMNLYTVGRATQGLADYLNAHFEQPSVAIARDSRNKGELFVRHAAAVLAANGVTAHVYPRIEPTPALSFAVRDLGCSGGICMTASHNPAPYNGYKVYGPDGCQITSEAASDISVAIAKVDPFSGVKTVSFDEGVEAGLIRWIGEDTLDRYIDAVAAAGVDPGSEADLKVVYTPLCGCGRECVERILDRIGVTDVVVVPEQGEPNGNFPTCEYPNPEERAALQKGIDLCEQVRPDLLLATDPDADRVGVAVKDEGEYVLLTGNEMGVLLLDYLARRAMEEGGALDGRIAVTTIVSSTMVDALAGKYGFSVRRVLTGFKYIGEIIGELEACGEEGRFLFGFEESYGYLNGTYVRDKDAVDASMLICQMARYYKARGMNLAQAMRALYEEHGYFRNKTLSFSFPGADGAASMADLMACLRNDPPTCLAGRIVAERVDYQPGEKGLPPANVVEFIVEGGHKVVFRPSGTEPKVKAYLFASGPSAAAADAVVSELGDDVRGFVDRFC